jgi:hypothetical protein
MAEIDLPTGPEAIEQPIAGREQSGAGPPQENRLFQDVIQ